uniref:C2H2-type domain-containing protein n=1 Tax=viral metagenome TaxID=1070528 RepID=A0A6C0CUI0_9ZZZZ
MLTCAHCSYITSRTYNLNRHISSKHSSVSIVPLHNDSNDINTINYNQNINIEEQNTNIGEQNINMEEQNINMEEQNINMEEQNINIEKSVEEISDDGTETKGNKEYKCDMCYKYFSYLKTLKRHTAICKKIQHPYECMNCHKQFACSSSLCVHRKGCTSTALITTPSGTVPNNNNIHAHTIDTLNNNIIQNQQNIEQQNNQNITINVFPTSLHTDYSIDTSHIDEATLKKNIKHQSIYEAVGTSLRMVLENRDNLPVKKKSIKSNYSYVHLGEDRWEMRKDKEIYGMISFHISRCIQVYLDGKNLNQLKKYYQEATEALEFAATDNMADLEREYVQKAKRIMEVILLAAYDRPDREQTGPSH